MNSYGFRSDNEKNRNFPAFWLRVAIRVDQIDRQTGYLVVNSFPTASVDFSVDFFGLQLSHRRGRTQIRRESNCRLWGYIVPPPLVR